MPKIQGFLENTVLPTEKTDPGNSGKFILGIPNGHFEMIFLGGWDRPKSDPLSHKTANLQGALSATRGSAPGGLGTRQVFYREKCCPL